MRTIVIFKTATPDERIVLRTDSMYDDYESVFTVMTVEGSIEGVINEFKGGSIISLSTISRFVANNTGIEAVAMSPDDAKLDVAVATPKFLSIDVFPIFNETSYREHVSAEYQEHYSYEDSKDSLPWLAIKSVKAVLATPFDLEISHNGSACTFGGNSETVGTVSGTKITISDFQNVMFACKDDLGVDDPKGVWQLKFTMNGITDIREVVIS